MILGTLGLARTAAAQPKVYVLGEVPGFGQKVFAVDSSGSRTVVVSYTIEQLNAGYYIWDIAFAPDGTLTDDNFILPEGTKIAYDKLGSNIYYLEPQLGSPCAAQANNPPYNNLGCGELFSTGAVRALITDFGDATKGPVGFLPSAVAVEPQGTILVIALTGAVAPGGTSSDVPPALFRVNAANGIRTLLSDFKNPAQGPTAYYVPSNGKTNGLAVQPGGAIFVLRGFDYPESFGRAAPAPALLRIDPVTGMRTVASDFTNPALGPVMNLISGATVFDGMAATVGGSILVAASVSYSLATQSWALWTVDPGTGRRAIFSDFSNPAQGPGATNLIALAYYMPPSSPEICWPWEGRARMWESSAL